MANRDRSTHSKCGIKPRDLDSYGHAYFEMHMAVKYLLLCGRPTKEYSLKKEINSFLPVIFTRGGQNNSDGSIRGYSASDVGLVLVGV